MHLKLGEIRGFWIPILYHFENKNPSSIQEKEINFQGAKLAVGDQTLTTIFIQKSVPYYLRFYK
jgi:hypothetical protein